MFAPKLERLKTMVRWAFEELKVLAVQDVDVRDVELLAGRFEKVANTLEMNGDS